MRRKGRSWEEKTNEPAFPPSGKRERGVKKGESSQITSRKGGTLQEKNKECERYVFGVASGPLVYDEGENRRQLLMTKGGEKGQTSRRPLGGRMNRRFKGGKLYEGKICPLRRGRKKDAISHQGQGISEGENKRQMKNS